jgi:hypothetical protein
MVAASSKGTSNIPWVFDLTCFSRSQRTKFVHAHLDDAYAITQKIFDLDFLGVWVGYGMEQFPPSEILIFTYIFISVSLFTILHHMLSHHPNVSPGAQCLLGAFSDVLALTA